MATVGLTIISLLIAAPGLAQERQDEPSVASSVAPVGHRLSREQAVPNVKATGRISNRLANRIESRLDSRIEGNRDPRPDALMPFKRAEQSSKPDK